MNPERLREGKAAGRVFLCLLVLFAESGCAVFVIGAAGAAGGYAVSADGIEGILDKDYDRLWRTAEDILKRQGTIEWADRERGKMKARRGHSTIQFKMEQATPHSVVIRVQARKWEGAFPDMNLARRIYSMIVHQ